MNDKGKTVLMDASLFGRPEVVRLLLVHGTDPSQVDECGGTALFYARRCHAVAKILLEDSRTNVDAKNNKSETALHVTTRQNRLEIVTLLLAYGANPLLNDANGVYALDFARFNRALLENGLYDSWDARSKAYEILIKRSDHDTALNNAQQIYTLLDNAQRAHLLQKARSSISITSQETLAATEALGDTATLAELVSLINVNDSGADEKTLAVANYVLGRAPINESTSAGGGEGMLEEHFIDLMDYFLPTKE